jgi:hypothetical protein
MTQGGARANLWRLLHIGLRPHRRFAVLVWLFFVTALAIMGTGGKSALAASIGGPDCLNQPKVGHCYEITEYNPPSGTAGDYMAFSLLPMASGGSSLDHQYHVNNTLWAVFPGDNNFIEAGVANAFVPRDGWNECIQQNCFAVTYDATAARQSPGCAASGCGAYYLYWADHNQVGGVNYHHIHVVAFTSPSWTPPTEYVDIRWNFHGNNQWAVDFYGSVLASDNSGVDDPWHTVSTVEAGLEVQAPAGAADCAAAQIATVGDWSHSGSTWSVTWPNTPAASQNTSDPRFFYVGSANHSGRFSFRLNAGYNGC